MSVRFYQITMIYTNANIKNYSLGIVMLMQQSVLLKGNATV